MWYEKNKTTPKENRRYEIMNIMEINEIENKFIMTR